MQLTDLKNSRNSKVIILKSNDLSSEIELNLIGALADGTGELTLTNKQSGLVSLRKDVEVVDSKVTFTIDKVLRNGDYELEITLNGQKFPSDNSFVVRVNKSVESVYVDDNDYSVDYLVDKVLERVDISDDNTPAESTVYYGLQNINYNLGGGEIELFLGEHTKDGYKHIKYPDEYVEASKDMKIPFEDILRELKVGDSFLLNNLENLSTIYEIKEVLDIQNFRVEYKTGWKGDYSKQGDYVQVYALFKNRLPSFENLEL